MLKNIKTVSLLLLALTLAACSETRVQESTGQYLDSSATTAKVKANLVDQLGSKGLAIKVKTFKDEVQLSGFVNNQTLKNRAGSIARNVPDVKRVRNDIVVK